MCLYEFLDDARGECTSHSLGRAFVCAYVEIRDYKYVFMILHYWPGLSKPGQYSVAFPFLRWGIFLLMGTDDFRKFLTSLIFFYFFILLSSNAIIKQCNIHIYSISNLGYHTII